MDASVKYSMTCEQAEALVLDLDRNGSVEAAERVAALAHLSRCSRCAALMESWDSAKEELRALAAETCDAQTPERVKMRLMLEFRTRHHQAAVKRAGFVAAWALVGAAVLLAGVALWNSQHSRLPQNPRQNLSAATAGAPGTQSGAQNQDAEELVAGLSNFDDSSDFTPLPGVVPSDTGEAAILRVRMQRSSLSALGLPVNEQRAGEWIQVDLLVGTDGLPQGVRLAQEEN